MNKTIKKSTKLLSTVLVLLLIAGISIVETSHSSMGDAMARSVSTTGVSGYDLVSYQTGEKPLRGNGNHLSVINGETYLFINEQNKKMFDRNPQKYLPGFGGYCAYGVSVGKKFVGDPDVWKIVDGKLYLNLDTKIQGLWIKDIEGNVAKANIQWNDIKNIPAEKL